MTTGEGSLLGQQCAGPLSSIFDAVGASAVGCRHLAAGRPCEDFFRVQVGQDWVVAVVSDGAGSASRALEGAMVVTEEICRVFAGRMSAQISSNCIEAHTFSTWVKSGVCEGVERARKRCLTEAREHESLAEFHATLVGAAMVGEEGALFHLGDGCASAHRNMARGIETIAFSEPENGEYINETFFFTESWWRQHLRITKIREVADEVWLMTDGAYELVVPPNQRQLRQFTVSEMDRLIFSETAENRASVLTEILSSSQAKRSDDDKTIVIVRRLQANG